MKHLFLILSICAAQLVSGQGSDLFPQDRLQELREAVVFEYPEEEKVPDPPDNPFAKFDLEAFRAPLIWGISLVVLAGLAFLIYRILRDLDLKKRAAAAELTERKVTVAEIVEEDMVREGVSTTLLERAEKAGQYDIAVRLLYISLLKELQDARLISYRKHFTNRDYRRQMENTALSNEFTDITATYERYWYGKHPVDRLTYRLLQKGFTSLTGRIHA